MFFFLSKALWLFVHPLNLPIFALFGALGLASFGRRKAAFLLTLGAALLLGLAAWTTLGDLLLEPLESRFRRPDPPPAHVDGIILLGGGLEGMVNHVRGGYEMNGGGDRFVEAVVPCRRHLPAGRRAGGNGHWGARGIREEGRRRPFRGGGGALPPLSRCADRGERWARHGVARHRGRRRHRAAAFCRPRHPARAAAAR